ncbi:MAG: formylmethanofuran--tetrahydromethanopterin N-formyltransferase [Candidatus Hodarchaeales archaeon]
MSEFFINGVPVEDTFCETFSARMSRLLITSVSRKWALESALEAKGLGRSATIPPCEAYLEREVKAEDTPDGRPGFIVHLSDRKYDNLKHWLIVRIRKGVIPIPKTSVFDALPRNMAEKFIDIKDSIIQTFGDGFEEEMEKFGRKIFRIPRMDGWFHVETKFGVIKAITGGMFLILGNSEESALLAAEQALESVTSIDGVVGKIAASGSKVGGINYTNVVATTNDAYCPLLPANERKEISDDVKCVYEVIVSGLRLEDIEKAMKIGIEKATSVSGVLKITSTNYGGTLGKGRIYLKQLFDEAT